MAEQMFVITREMSSESCGTWTTVLAVATNESAANALVAMAELQLEAARLIDRPTLSNWTPDQAKDWAEITGRYLQRVKSYEAIISQIMTFDPNLKSDVREESVGYNSEAVPAFSVVP